MTGKRGGVFYKTVNNHLYRFNKPAKNNKVFLYCYHVRITKDSPINFLRAAASIFGKTNKKYFGELIASLERDPLLGGETIDVEADEDDDENQVDKSGQ